MKKRARILGVDFGTRRVGLAVSDRGGGIASPLKTYERRDATQDANFFAKLVQDEEIGQIVIGLPVHLAGHEGGIAAQARKFGDWLQNITKLPLTYWDERFTSADAEEHLLAAGLTSKQRKARRDMLAAQILLQTYLDAGCPEKGEIRPLEG